MLFDELKAVLSNKIDLINNMIVRKGEKAL